MNLHKEVHICIVFTTSGIYYLKCIVHFFNLIFSGGRNQTDDVEVLKTCISKMIHLVLNG